MHFRKSVLNQCPKKKTPKPQTPRFHLTHPCFELCPNSSPSYTADYQPWISCLRESYTTTHFCKAIPHGRKNKGINIGIHVFWPCLLMSFDVFPCAQIYSNRCMYIIIYSNRLSTNPDANLANARERCWRQHPPKKKTARPENKNLYWGLRVYAVSTSSSRNQNYLCRWKPVNWSSPWVAAEFCGKSVWINTSDPSLSLTLLLKIQPWMKPLSLTLGKAFPK